MTKQEKLIQKELDNFEADCKIYDMKYAIKKVLEKIWEHQYRIETELLRNRKY